MTATASPPSSRHDAAHGSDDISRAVSASAAVSVSGILDARGNQAFLRSAGYRRGRDDVCVPNGLLRRHGLRTGDLVQGTARAPRPDDPATRQERDNQPARQRRNGPSPRQGPAGGPTSQGGDRRAVPRDGVPRKHLLDQVDAVNGMDPALARTRQEFDELTPLYPSERLRLEAGSASATARIIDLVTPVGKGQRGLIVSAPKAGKTMVLAAIAGAVAVGNPDVHLMVVLVGERPEEVTDLRRSVRGDVIFSTFDQSADDHIMVAELAVERAKRLVELGRDVVMLLDSITRLGRAYNLAAPASSRILAGGVATTALQPPRQFLGAARNTEEGGSLTILSTALVDTGSRMDDVFFEEFKGTGNMELRLRRDLADKRIYPAIDVLPSGTRRDDLLMPPDERAATDSLRRALAGLDAQQALELLLDKTSQTASNREFLRLVTEGTHPRPRRVPSVS